MRYLHKLSIFHCNIPAPARLRLATVTT